MITCSQLYRIVLCPGSENLAAKAPPAAPSVQADEGKLLHRCYNGQKIEENLNSYQQWCVEYCNTKTEEIVKQVFGDKKPVVLRETPMKRNGVYWGTPDFFAHRAGTALVIDPKFGPIPVEPAESNWQLRGYIVGGRSEIIIQRAFGAILQPKLEEEADRCKMVEYSAEDIDQSEKEIDLAIKMTQDPNASLNPTPSGCRYCPARSICSEVKSLVHSLVEAHTSEVLDPVIMADYLRKARIVKAVCENIEYHALQLAKNGVTLPGFKIKKGRNTRTVTDTMKAYEAMNGILTPEQFTAACKVQMGELDETFKTATGLKGKKAVEALEAKLIDAHALEKKTGEPSLVEEK